MAMKDTTQKMRTLLGQIEKDLDKACCGNKAAAQRARTTTIKFEKLAKLFRKESVKECKKMKKPARKKTTAKKKAAPKRKTTVTKKATTSKTTKRKFGLRKTAKKKAAPKRRTTARRSSRSRASR